MDETFGSKLKKLREQKGLTVEQVSKGIKNLFAPSVIKKMEMSLMTPCGWEPVIRLADFFSVPRKEFLLLALYSKMQFYSEQQKKRPLISHIEIDGNWHEFDEYQRRIDETYDFIRKIKTDGEGYFDSIEIGYDRREKRKPGRKPKKQ
jgi:transcriptional regulator with XRE-family HTH domain